MVWLVPTLERFPRSQKFLLCKEVLRAKGYLRYMDDFALFHDSADQLDEWRQRIARYLQGRQLRLHPRKTAIERTSEPAQFLGFVLQGDGGGRLPEDNVRRWNRWPHGQSGE